MKYSDDFRRCLIDLDVVGVRRLWKHVAPHLPQPKDDAEAITTLHAARTQAESVPFRLRAYSHRWLLERGFPSGLPDHLKPKAERLYPKVVDAVGIAVRSQDGEKALRIRTAMSDAVEETYADGHTNPEIVKARMMEARARQLRQE